MPGETVSKVRCRQGYSICAGTLGSVTAQLNDGRLEIDNNAAERALRAIALGRKNYLFQGSDAGGEYAAAMYTLIGTAKLNDLDPEAYLSYVLSRIADHSIQTLDELLPWNTPVRFLLSKNTKKTKGTKKPRRRLQPGLLCTLFLSGFAIPPGRVSSPSLCGGSEGIVRDGK
jgi:hypothetical protein